MEQIENKAILDEYWETEHKNWDKRYEAMAEKEDESYQDKIEEELLDD